MPANLTPIVLNLSPTLNATIQNATVLNATLIQQPQTSWKDWLTVCLAVAALITAIAAIRNSQLAKRTQDINRDITREERFHKEMDLLIKILYSKRDEYEKFEPHHVDYNNWDDVRNVDNFWGQVAENKYLAPKELGNLLDKYLELISRNKQEIEKRRTTFSDILSKECKRIDKDFEAIGEVYKRPGDQFIKDKLCPILGENGLVKPMPIHDRQKTEYLNAFEQIRNDFEQIQSKFCSGELISSFLAYFDAIKAPELPGTMNIEDKRRDLARAVKDRYTQLDEKIKEIKINLEEPKHKHWWHFW